MKNINRKFYLIATLLFTITAFSNLIAAEGEDTVDKVMKFMLVVTIIMIAFVLWLIVVYSEKQDSEGKIFKSPFTALTKFLTRSTPIEKEQEILLAHNYDGIRELDNRIPPWFHILFYGTIIWAAIYMLAFHVFDDGQVQSTEYKVEIEQAKLEREFLIRTGAFINEETVKFVNDPASIAEGKEIYIKNCATCHGQSGEGLVGPNLTDDNWIHGGGIKNIFKVIKYGVPAKGMISWETQLDPKKMQAASSYIITLQGTNPPNGKAPEGEKWIEPETSEGS
ncbi:MAG TPA: cbb3-type cytochrome c oxidase N-terminal domain-containing protein [Melioribacteraceae bacterium]|nr:cbb3-type cytochrome c oxidase N-terminal domain-containing protein [Melioribacteraceae bacterium]